MWRTLSQCHDCISYIPIQVESIWGSSITNFGTTRPYPARKQISGYKCSLSLNLTTIMMIWGSIGLRVALEMDIVTRQSDYINTEPRPTSRYRAYYSRDSLIPGQWPRAAKRLLPQSSCSVVIHPLIAIVSAPLLLPIPGFARGFP